MKYKGVPIDSISIFTTPVLYLQLALYLLLDLVSWFKELLLRRGMIMIAAIAVCMLITRLDSLQVR